MTVYRRADAAGGRKAPRHEIAGNEARLGQRALWGFERGGSDVGASVLALTEDSQISETVRVCGDEDAGMHLAVS